MLLLRGCLPASNNVPDSVSKIPDLTTLLSQADALGKSTNTKQLVQIVVYDLPDRDCAAKASNGEFSIANNGQANYQTYIDGIVSAVKRKFVQHFRTSMEHNLVLRISRCPRRCYHRARLPRQLGDQLERPEVRQRPDHLPRLRQIRAPAARRRRRVHVHGCWSCWLARLARQLGARCSALRFSLFGRRQITIHQGSCDEYVRHLPRFSMCIDRLFFLDVANYNALSAATPDPITQGNPNYDEIHYINVSSPSGRA